MVTHTQDEIRPKLRAVKMRLPDGTRRTSLDVWNTSLGGVFIASDEPLGFGKEVDLVFEFPRDADTIECEGFVVWTSLTAPEKSGGRSGMALRLVNIGIADMRRLAEAVGREI